MPDGLAPFPATPELKRAFAARGLAVFLDVDGTLLEIAQRPDAVRVSAALRELLARLLAESGGAVALVSGRLLEDLDHLFAPLRLPAAGLHGLQRRDAEGRIHVQDHSSELADVRRILSAASYEGFLIEDKGSALVVHFRTHPHLEARGRALADEAVAATHGAFEVVPGKMSFEIRVARFGKRDALAAFMSEAPFSGRQPVFMGDDVSDEEGFAYVNEIDGHSVHIGTDPELTCARACLRSPRDVFRLLEELLEAATGDYDVLETF